MSLFSSIFGGKPTVPELKPIDYGQVQQDAIQQNINAAPLAAQLTSQTNTLNQNELNRLLQGAIPDISQIQSNISKNLASETAGQLSPDVQAAVERSGIAKSLGRFGGSMAGEFVGRDIGRTSYDIANQAMTSAERWIQLSRQSLMPGVMSVESMFVTPQQRLAQTTEERNLQFERNWLKNQISAMPDPVAHGVWQSIDSYIHSYGGANSYAPTQYPQMGGGGGIPVSTGGGTPGQTNFTGGAAPSYPYPDWAQLPYE